MHLRRPAPSRVVAAVALLALIAAPLSSCGFENATDREYTPGSGTNNREGEVKVLSAVVVSAEAGSGTVIASLANTDTEEARSLTAVSGVGLTPSELAPIEIGPDALVDLAAEEAGITLTGELESGDFVELSFDFDNGERATLDVPVVPNDSGYWEGLDVS